MIDAKAFGQELAVMVKTQLSPILSRLDAMEKRIAAIPAPVDLSEELAALKSMVEAIEIPEPIAPELPDFAAMIADEVKTAVSAIPVPKDGENGSDGKDGVSVELDDVLPVLEKRVNEFLSAIPAPQDGKSVAVEDVAPLVASEVEKRVSELPRAKDGKDGTDGKDGVSLAGAFIDRDGNLAITLSNGEVKSLGPVAGKDGEPGKPGEDGFGFDDLSVEYDGEKTMTLKFAKGERVKEFPINMPVPIDRGVFRDDGEYKSGDGVSWAGSFWIAQKDNPTGKPDAGDWRLSVKRGRDGRDGVVKSETTPKVKI